MNPILSSTVIGVELHRLGLKFNEVKFKFNEAKPSEISNFSVVFESQIPNSTLRRRMFIINTTTSVEFDQNLWCLSQILTDFQNFSAKF